MKFEESLQRLEQITQELAEKTLPLEEAEKLMEQQESAKI